MLYVIGYLLFAISVELYFVYKAVLNLGVKQDSIVGYAKTVYTQEDSRSEQQKIEAFKALIAAKK